MRGEDTERVGGKGGTAENGLEARVYRLLDSAELTLDLATPVEGAGASLDDRHLLRLVASAAAHQVAAVDSDAGVVALPAVSAKDAQLRVLLAEERRGLQVDEIDPWDRAACAPDCTASAGNCTGVDDPGPPCARAPSCSPSCSRSRSRFLEPGPSC